MEVYGLCFLGRYVQTQIVNVVHDVCQGLIGPAPCFPQSLPAARLR